MAALRAVLVGLWAALQCGAQKTNQVEQEVKFIWPTAVWNMQLVGTKNDGISKLGLPSGSEGDAVLYSRLADVGERGSDRYRSEVMPKELKVDEPFAKEFAGPDDGSLSNLAFFRWQKRVFADHARLPIEELNWDGKPVPRHKQIGYKWPEMYGSDELRVLQKRVEPMSLQFLSTFHGQNKMRFRTMPWVQVFRPGEFSWPHMYTGAAVCGAFFARHAENSSELVFEDVRGMNPPFGHSHTHVPEQGELVLFPSWAPHKFTPNQGSSTNVVYRFLLWPEGGAHEFDWEDDATGDYVYRKTTNVKRQPETSKGKADPSLPPPSTGRTPPRAEEL